jgi:hypothetical protein
MLLPTQLDEDVDMWCLGSSPNHEGMQTIPAKSKGYPTGNKMKRGYMPLLPTSLICMKISRNLSIMGRMENVLSFTNTVGWGCGYMRLRFEPLPRHLIWVPIKAT